MTTVAYPLAAPPAAAMRGGDCRGRDLSQGPRLIVGPHRFASPEHCRINNGLLRLTVGQAGAAPALTVDVRRGAITVDDTYVDTYSDIYGGSTSVPEWFALGTLTIDSPAAPAVLSAVRLVAITPEAVTIRLVAPAIADAFVTLERGVPGIQVQHGDTRADPGVSTTRRIRWTASPSPVGAALTQRVEEVGGTQGLTRFVGGLDAVTTDAGAFAATTSAVDSARLCAGVGTYDDWSHASALHSQLGDASRPVVVIT